MFFSILALAAAAGPSSGQLGEVERAIFDLCPQAISGALSLSDAGQVGAVGYAIVAPRETPGGPMPRIVRGAGADRIVISARREGNGATCGVWFGGPENRRLFRAVTRRARTEGYSGGPAGALGDGTRMHMYRRGGAVPATLAIFNGDAGGEVEVGPATTVITMTGIE